MRQNAALCGNGLRKGQRQIKIVFNVAIQNFKIKYQQKSAVEHYLETIDKDVLLCCVAKGLGVTLLKPALDLPGESVPDIALSLFPCVDSPPRVWLLPVGAILRNTSETINTSLYI